VFTLTGYDKFKLIHEGARNDVYTAIRVNDQKTVIVKTLHSNNPEPNEIAIVCHEYEITKDLDLPGVINTYALIEEKNLYALIQEDIQGVSLSGFVKQNPINDLSIFFKIAFQMVASIRDIHRNRIVHKDIKPDNFIIDPKTCVVKLTDFNFATKLLHEFQEVVPPERLEGTLAYMAPEQTGRMNMNIDYRSDFYALGATYYELLTGQLPFQFQDPLEVVHAHLATEPPDASKINNAIPKSLAKLIQKLMAKDPSRRYESTIGIQFDLERCAKSENNPFPLGLGDVHDHLNLSQKLYGRQDEAKVLLETYERISHGGNEALMVCGYSGVGKTMLINEVHKPMVKDKGYFISGKFDQLERNTPYTAIMQAFNQLARLILSEPEERFQKIKENIIEALGRNAKIIINLAPDIELITGPQPELQEFTPQEMQNLLIMVFKLFLRAITKNEHPLVVFIDDLQWVDSGTLKLLEYLLTDDELTHVLLIGAYRDNEVDEHHPLKLFFKEMNKQVKKIQFLPLNPLKPTDYLSLFRDSFNRDEEIIKPFAELVYKRTEGNPFFCKQVIKTIYKDQLLYFDYNQHQWDWDLEKISSLKITDNVIDLMLNKIEQLPLETQALLKYPACIGNRFTIEILMLVTGQSADSISKALWPALQEEMIITLHLGYKQMDAMSHQNLSVLLSKEITYQFIHDRVQQAMYQSISPNERGRIHLSIARIIKEKEPEAYKNERLFEVADHYNQAHGLLEEKEISEVIKLNYQAGLKAQNANAYQPMLNYLRSGIVLTTDNDWKKNYELIFLLNYTYAFGLYIAGFAEKSIEFTENLLKHAQNGYDTATLYRVLSLNQQVKGNMILTLELGLKALRALGINISNKPSMLSVWAKYLQVKIAFRKYKPDTLERELKPLVDKQINLVFIILTDLYSSIISVPGNIYLYAPLEAMHLILRYGWPSSAAAWITLYSIASLTLSKNVDNTFDLWDIAKRFHERGEDKYSSGPLSIFGYVFFLNHLRYPFNSVYSYCLRGIEDARESNNIYLGAMNRAIYMSSVVCESKSIIDSRQINEDVINFSRKNNLSEYTESYTRGIRQLDEEAGTIPPCASLWEIYAPAFFQNNEIWDQTSALMEMARGFFLRESFESACECHFKWFSEERRMRYVVYTFSYKTFDALSISKCIPKLPYFKRLSYHIRFNRLYRDLKWASKECPHNYLHQYLLLEGTLHKFKKNYIKALQCFDQAVKNALKSNSFLWVGISNELAGELLMEQGLSKSAIEYIRESHYYYNRYGIGLKVKKIEEKYPEAFSHRGDLIDKRSASQPTVSTSSTSSELDFASIIKASQSISGEILLENLFKKMLHITIENAGAQKAIFVEQQNKQWQVTALLMHENETEQFQILNIPLNKFEDIAIIVVNSCFRAKEPVIIDNPIEDSRFASDPYIAKNMPKSILCLPIIHQDKLIGLIYLENNLTSGAFTADRITVLSTLSAQIAISLQNARHIDHTESLYKSAERFIPKRFLQLLDREHMEDVQLGDSVKREVSAMFADIRGFTTLAESLTPELTALFLNTYMQYMEPIIREHNGFINQFLGDGILALFPEDPSDSVDAAVSMIQELSRFNEDVVSKGFTPISVGIGINTGEAMIFALGVKERMDASVVSDAINTASRVEGLNKFYETQLLISESVYQRIKHPEKYLIRMVDKVLLKGKNVGTSIYEVCAPSEKGDIEDERHYFAIYRDAFAAYVNGDFAKAEEAFRKFLVHKPGDAVAEMLLERCVNFQHSGAPEGWDGTFKMLEK
jgi:predicted ATPase/class 3 adenylate cyclase